MLCIDKAETFTASIADAVHVYGVRRSHTKSNTFPEVRFRWRRNRHVPSRRQFHRQLRAVLVHVVAAAHNQRLDHYAHGSIVERAVVGVLCVDDLHARQHGALHLELGTFIVRHHLFFDHCLVCAAFDNV